MPTKHQVVKQPVAPVGAHSWNGDRTKVAVSPNNHLVHVYAVQRGNFVLEHTLENHTQRVTSIDWAPKTNRIVTCAADRNAYVWEFKEGAWKPALVILRINRAATCCKWSPKENKFAVGSGARLISVCYFEEENDWWVSKHIKKPIRSTVLSVDWHPNNVLLAAGCSDFTARIFSGYIKAKNDDGVPVDEKPAATCWGKKMPFGAMMAQFSGASTGGWVHDVAFSASGEELAFVGHDAAISVANGNAPREEEEGGGFTVARLDTSDLPFRAVDWVTPNSIVAAGHGYVPVLFTYTDGALTKQGKVDVPVKKAAKQMSAMAKFQTLDRKGTSASDKTTTSVESTHQNAISNIGLYKGDRSACEEFCTAGVDGQLVIWKMSEIRALEGINVA